jgi:hypothetical protein
LRLPRPPPNRRAKEEPLRLLPLRRRGTCRKTSIREEQLDEQVRALLASIAIRRTPRPGCKAPPRARGAARVYHQTVVKEIRTEINEQELLMDRRYDDRLHRLIAENFFRQRWDQLEEKRSQLSRDLARHQALTWNSAANSSN